MAIKKRIHEADEREEANTLINELGFKFAGTGDEFGAQPDSGSTIGGLRGLQENGINGDVSTEELYKEINGALSINQTLDSMTDAELGGVSEWSLENATNEEEVIDDFSNLRSNEQDKKVIPIRQDTKSRK